MSSHLEAKLSQALSVRLNLQVSLTSLPIVEEWMDIHLTRWLESVPLPPELPMGHTAHFGVSIASDLSRLRWDAYGNPDGFIPKMSEYFDKCKMSKQDTQLLDAMGERLEPQLVGSWVAVSDGKVSTGWQFCDKHLFADITDLFGDHEARHKLVDWMTASDVTELRRFAQTIGENAASEIELAVPGVAVDDQLTRVASAFEILAGVPLAEPVRVAMSSAVATGFTVAVTMKQGVITRVSAVSPGLGNDILAQLCAETSVPFDSKLTKIVGALGADGADRVHYSQLPGMQAAQVDVLVVPSDTQSPPLREMN